MDKKSFIPPELKKEISLAQQELKEILTVLLKEGSFSQERYIRFLSYQYHLTKGVQRHFFAIAAHNQLVGKNPLRKFLIQFGFDEEDHYLIAERDAHALQSSILPMPLDVKVWWAYFDRVILDKPFIRLGATCILENISEGSADIVGELLRKSNFLSPRNTRFLEIHRHGENLPHGAMILDELGAAELSEDEWRDVVCGASEARTLYLRLVKWAFTQ